MIKLKIAALASVVGVSAAQLAVADDPYYSGYREHRHWHHHHAQRAANPRLDRGRSTPNNGTGNYHNQDRFAMPDGGGR